MSRKFTTGTDRLGCTAPTNLEIPTGDWTAAALFNPVNAGAVSFGRIFEGGSGSNLDQALLYDSSLDGRLSAQQGFSTTACKTWTDSALTYGIWQWLFAVYDDASKTITLWHRYLGGAALSQPSQTKTAGVGTRRADSPLTWSVGNRATGDRGFNGDIGRVGLWARQLSVGEMDEIAIGNYARIPNLWLPMRDTRNYSDLAGTSITAVQDPFKGTLFSATGGVISTADPPLPITTKHLVRSAPSKVPLSPPPVIPPPVEPPPVIPPATAPKLVEGPPSLSSPITVQVTNTSSLPNYPGTQDLIVRLPCSLGASQRTPLRRSGSFIGQGGHNIVVRGGWIDVDADYPRLHPNYDPNYVHPVGSCLPVGSPGVGNGGLWYDKLCRAFYWNNWTGTLFIEGMLISGDWLYECFNFGSTDTNARLVIQNCLVDARVQHKGTGTSGAGNHDGGDLFQPWYGPKYCLIDRLTLTGKGFGGLDVDSQPTNQHGRGSTLQGLWNSFTYCNGTGNATYRPTNGWRVTRVVDKGRSAYSFFDKRSFGGGEPDAILTLDQVFVRPLPVWQGFNGSCVVLGEGSTTRTAAGLMTGTPHGKASVAGSDARGPYGAWSTDTYVDLADGKTKYYTRSLNSAEVPGKIYQGLTYSASEGIEVTMAHVANGVDYVSPGT